MITAHDIVTAILIYLSIGAVCWLVLDGLGVITNTFASRPKATAVGMVLASVMMIVIWPKFVYVWLVGAWRVSR